MKHRLELVHLVDDQPRRKATISVDEEVMDDAQIDTVQLLLTLSLHDLETQDAILDRVKEIDRARAEILDLVKHGLRAILEG
jgi:hypothetical protein